jgi:hypothetical protein
MNFMRQAQVSAMVHNASGQSALGGFAASGPAGFKGAPSKEARELFVPLAQSAGITVNVVQNPVTPAARLALKQAIEAAIRSQKEFAASVACRNICGVLDVTRLEDAEPRLVKPKRSPNCKPATSGLTTEAAAGRYQGLGFRSE